MNKKNRKIILFLGTFFAFFLKANFVLAFEINYPNINVLGQNFSLDSTSSFYEYMCYIFGLGTDLGIFISVIVIAFGGIYYLISYGKGSFTDEGKNWIKAGILGFLIVVCTSLIAYTINPNLTNCKLGILSIIGFDPFGDSTTLPNANIITYKEIPIGTLTETLLTRTMGCYGFDLEGNPIDYATIDPDITLIKDDGGSTYSSPQYFLPTYLKYDRLDCLTQLIDGSHKKAQMAAGLSDEITKLMDTCDCRVKDASGHYTGASKCDAFQNCAPPANCPSGQNECDEANMDVWCKTKTPPYNNIPDCCEEGIKNMIEHGPIDLSFDIDPSGVYAVGECEIYALGYNGLDEFRCPNPLGGGAPCPDDPDSDYGTEMIDWVEKQIIVNGSVVGLINQDKWNKLNLRQQLTYFHEKIAHWTENSGIQDDIDMLDKAKSALASPQCYLAIPYVDLARTYESTNKKDHIILTQKFSDAITGEPIFDPVTGSEINISTYCKGFNWANSSCLKKCNDACPDTNMGINYQTCTDTDPETCLDVYSARPCPNSDEPFSNFEGCMSSCQDKCITDCENKYLPCSGELNLCESQCENNGQCVLDNAGDCLFGANAFADCKNQQTDQGNFDYCINNAYLCKNGSNEYAGYPDCIEPKLANCSSFHDQTHCESSIGCLWNNTECLQDYSASFLYNDKINNDGEYQKCPYPYNPPEAGKYCYNKINTEASCQELCPETTKCPASSDCPYCPCDQIDGQTLKFSIPNTSLSDKNDPAHYNAGNEGYYTSSQTISIYEMVGPQCNEYSYNDDPLTFYCEDQWWNNPNKEESNPTPMGRDRICSKSGEIPIGQTVDDAENWARELINSAKVEKINEDIQAMIKQMKKIGSAGVVGKAYNYCKCDAKLDNDSPICKPGCTYQENYDENGVLTSCSCTTEICKGSPCRQAVSYLSELWNDYKQIKIDFVDFYTSALKDSRSDIMKELTYSRQTTDNCSFVGSSYNAQTRILSCTRAQDELISPINTNKIKFNGQTISGYCYGKDLGNLFNKSLTDNWFCCQEWSKNPTTTSNPIYNTQK
ncbi:MAG: hypothetical protein WCW01_06995 [Gammaproteobacteria bacterium]